MVFKKINKKGVFQFAIGPMVIIIAIIFIIATVGGAVLFSKLSSTPGLLMLLIFLGLFAIIRTKRGN